MLGLTIALYILIGVYVNVVMVDVMTKIPRDNENYTRAQEVINNLISFLGFSLAIFRWPSLVYIILFGGKDDP